MAEKINVELDEQFLNKFFGLTDKIAPDPQTVTLSMLKKQLDEIENATHSSKTGKTSVDTFSNSSSDDSSNMDTFNLASKSILIIDDLGVITYQLGVLIKKLGFETAESKEIYDAIEKFKKQHFDLVIMDLFIPTEREGFILLEELKKIAIGRQAKTKIGVMSASSKKEYKQLCKIKGAEFFVEKVDDWQKDLLNLIGEIL